jgi:glycerol uptake operon antiterminator
MPQTKRSELGNTVMKHKGHRTTWAPQKTQQDSLLMTPLAEEKVIQEQAPPPEAGATADRKMELRQQRQMLRLLLEASPVIPAVRSPEHLKQAVRAQGKIVYFLCGNPELLPEMSEIVRDAGKIAFVNLDLVQGLTRDATAVAYLAHHGIGGIASTHQEPLCAARASGLFTIERTFLLDSAGLQTALRWIDRVRQDAVEVLPAIVAPHLVRKLGEPSRDIPVIAGGLINTFREIENLREQGVVSVTVSNTALWLP